MGPNSLVGNSVRTLSLGQARLLAAVVGLELWLVALVGLPAPIIERIFLAAPLVIVPALLVALASRTLLAPLSGNPLAPWGVLLAALPLLAAFALPPGPPATVLALPWIALCAAAGVAALLHAVPRLPALLRPSGASDLATDAAFGLLALGGLFLLAHRLGADPLNLGATLMLLGAVHYHFLGFGLLALTSLAARLQPRTAFVAILGIVSGMPLAAAGLTLGTPGLNWLGVLLVGAGVYIVVALLVLLARREPSTIRRAVLVTAALALAVGVSLGIGWSSSLFFGFQLLDLDTMVRSHGALNAGAVLLASLAVVGRPIGR